MEPDQLDTLTTAFRDQLLACLEECAHGRRGLFSDAGHLGGDEPDWPGVARLRELVFDRQGWNPPLRLTGGLR